MKANPVIIVAGLKRAGTSLLMQMLQKGGIKTVVDEIRKPDHFNPKGYYDHIKIMSIDRKNPKPYAIDFIKELQAKAIKVYAGLLHLLPKSENLSYKIVFVERDIFEVWASRKKTQAPLQQKGNDDIIFFAIRQRENLNRIIEGVKTWLNERKDVDVLWVDYATVIEQPVKEAARIHQFLGEGFGINESEMVKVVEPTLYREKATQLFLKTDRSPTSVAALIDRYAANKIYCEIGIGEGHNLNAVSRAKRKFGIERTPYGVRRCKELFPDLEVIQGDFFKLYKNHPFEVCFLWIVYPYCKKFVDTIFEHNHNVIILIGINYYYHLPDGDKKREYYINAYPPDANAALWNTNLNNHLSELGTKGFTHQIKEVKDDNGEIFSVAIVQKTKQSN